MKLGRFDSKRFEEFSGYRKAFSKDFVIDEWKANSKYHVQEWHKFLRINSSDLRIDSFDFCHIKWSHFRIKSQVGDGRIHNAFETY